MTSPTVTAKRATTPRVDTQDVRRLAPQELKSGKSNAGKGKGHGKSHKN